MPQEPARIHAIGKPTILLVDYPVNIEQLIPKFSPSYRVIPVALIANETQQMHAEQLGLNRRLRRRIGADSNDIDGFAKLVKTEKPVAIVTNYFAKGEDGINYIDLAARIKHKLHDGAIQCFAYYDAGHPANETTRSDAAAIHVNLLDNIKSSPEEALAQLEKTLAESGQRPR